jgi:hypothetical protein
VSTPTFEYIPTLEPIDPPTKLGGINIGTDPYPSNTSTSRLITPPRTTIISDEELDDFLNERPRRVSSLNAQNRSVIYPSNPQPIKPLHSSNILGKSAQEAANKVQQYLENFGTEDALPVPLPIASNRRWRPPTDSEVLGDFIASDSESDGDDYYSKKKLKQIDEPPLNTFLMLVGPSGVGKSTIIQSVWCLL